MRRVPLLALLSCIACGGGQQQAAPAPAASAAPAAASPDGEMTLAQAEEIVAAFQKAHPTSADDPLRAPKSLEDVLAILK